MKRVLEARVRYQTSGWHSSPCFTCLTIGKRPQERASVPFGDRGLEGQIRTRREASNWTPWEVQVSFSAHLPSQECRAGLKRKASGKHSRGSSLITLPALLSLPALPLLFPIQSAVCFCGVRNQFSHSFLLCQECLPWGFHRDVTRNQDRNDGENLSVYHKGKLKTSLLYF